MSPSQKNFILPISTSPNNNEKPAGWPTTPEKPVDRPWQRKRICCGLCASSLAVIAIVIIVLSFTVFKVRDPTMRLNSIHFDNLDITKNLTVTADVSVKNPNALPFKFNSSTTSLLYRNNEVGTAYGPPGNVGAYKTLRTNVTMNVISSRLLADSNFMNDVQNGSLALQTSTMVGGKVTILGMFKRHVDVMMNCTVNVAIASQAILDQSCTQRMWL